MKVKKIITIISIFVLFVNNNIAQNIQMGKNCEKGRMFKSIAGQIGNSIYTSSFKDNDLFINKCSIETMAIESSQKISTNNMDLEKNNWEVLKVDDKIVFILGIWDRDVPNKIYGKTVVESDGKIIADGELKLITEFKSPEYDGKKIVMGRDIKVITSPEIDGLPSSNNKIVVYFGHMLNKLSDFAYTKSFSFILLDKDLNKLDEQVIDFGEKERCYLSDPKLDVDGNMYVIDREFNKEQRTKTKSYL